jgi:hypothetical protein
MIVFIKSGLMKEAGVRSQEFRRKKEEGRRKKEEE